MQPTRRRLLQASAYFGTLALAPRVGVPSVFASADGSPGTVPLPKGAYRRLGSPRFLTRWPTVSKYAFYKNQKLIGFVESHAVVWDVATGQVTREIPFTDSTDESAVDRIILGDQILTADCFSARNETRFCYYDIHTGELLKQIKTPLLSSQARLHPLGEHLIVADDNNDEFAAYSVLSGKLVWKSPVRGFEFSYAISANGKRLVISTRNGYYIYDAQIGCILGLIPSKQLNLGLVTGISPDGKIFCSSEGVAYSTDTGKQIWNRQHHEFHFLPDSKHVLVTMEDRSLGLLDALTGRVVRKLHAPVSDEITFSNDGKLIAFSDSEHHGVYLLDFESGKILPQSSSLVGRIRSIHTTPKTLTIQMMFEGDRTLIPGWYTWNIDQQRGSPETDEQFEKCYAPRGTDQLLSPDGKHIAKNDGKQLQILDAKTKKVTFRLKMQAEFEIGCWLDESQLMLNNEQQIRLLNIVSKKTSIIKSPNPNLEIVTIKVSGDRKTIACSMLQTNSITTIWIYHLDSSVSRVLQLDNQIDSFQFDYAGRRILVIQDHIQQRFIRKQAIVINTSDGSTVYSRVFRDDLHFDRTAVLSSDGHSCLFNFETSLADKNGTTNIMELIELYPGLVRKRWQRVTPFSHAIFSADNHTLFSAHAEAPIFQWDVYGEVSDPQSAPTPSEYDRLWNDLASANAEIGFRTVCRLVQHPEKALEFLGKYLEPTQKTKDEILRDIVEQLGDSNYRRRELADRKLREIADSSVEYLRKVLQDTELNFEARTRLTRILGNVYLPTPVNIRVSRCMEVLHKHNNKKTIDLLRRLANGAEFAFMTIEAKRVLHSLTS